MKMWPQKWKASASPGFTAFATTPPAVAASRPAPTRARKPRRELSPASESSASPIRSRSATSGPRRPGPARRRSAVASTLSSWARLLNVPLARTAPSGSRAIANGLPGIRSSLQTSASATSSKISTATAGSPARVGDRRLQPAADVAALRGEHGERQLAFGRALEALDQSPTRAPSSGPSSGISSAAAGPRRSRSIPTSRASARTATARPRQHEQRDREPEPEPLIGGQASLGQQREGREARRRGPGCAPPTASRRSSASRSRRRARRRARAGGPRRAPPRTWPSARRRARRPGRCPRRSRRPGRARSRPAAAQRDPAQPTRPRSRRCPARRGWSRGWRASAPLTPPGRAPATKRAISPSTPSS